MPNDDSPIFIVDGMAAAPRLDRMEDSFGVYNPSGVLPPIIRQGDRLQGIRNHLRVAFADGV